jgi:nicotinamide mononucleotide transporter
LNAHEIYSQFFTDIQHTTWKEFIAVFAGILSVWWSMKENILVYPSGLLSTVIYVWISFKGGLLGEASVNFYFTVMSVYGWILWAKKDQARQHVVQISLSSRVEWGWQLLFFGVCYAAVFFPLTYLKKDFAPTAIPWADAFASATAYTGMWLMAKKKVESWYWWIATDMASVPLYFVKHYVFTSVYYAVLLIIAVFGLAEWMQRAKERKYAD